MTGSPVPQPAACSCSNELGYQVQELIDLLSASLATEADQAGSEDVRALRRLLRGQRRAEDERRLESRITGARLGLVSSPAATLRSVHTELAGTAGLLVDAHELGLVVLLPGHPRPAGTDDRVARLGRRVLGVAPAARVGTSTVIARVSDLPRALDEATRALHHCRPGQALLADEAWFDIAVSRLRESILDSLAAPGPLDRMDDPSLQRLDLRPTLAAWLAHDGDARAAAASLHLHVNTLRYRLRRAVQVTGLDVGDPLQRLVAHLALSSE